MKTIYIITGQTASGKTDYAIKLAKVSGLHKLINFDSRQMYNYLDIVTGKDKKEIQEAGISMYLYDIVDPKTAFSSADFENLVIPLIRKQLDQNDHVILVGGTYLYVYYLLYGNSPPQQPNWELRKKLANKSIQELQELIIEKDPELLKKLNKSDIKNPHRLIRILEGKEPTEEMKFDFHIAKKLGLKTEELTIKMLGFQHESKEKLRFALQKRVVKRLQDGALEEVKNLFKKGFTIDDPGLNSIGYKQIIAYLNKEISYDKMIEDWVTKEFQYAKRQFTFMKKDPHISWNIV